MTSIRCLPFIFKCHALKTMEVFSKYQSSYMSYTFRSYTWRSDNQPESLKPKKKKKYRSNFLDSLRVHVKSGKGGQGLPTKGGSGGRGGDVIFIGDKDMTLKNVTQQCISQRYSATTGADSRFFCLFGENAKPLEVRVPIGITLVSEQGQKLGEINKTGDKVVVAKGGAGGCSENGFIAGDGQSHSLTLDLKLIADVGFLGFPNSGKSTMLKAMSNAQPKIASYPFTTVKPNIGIIEFDDFRKISLADLPGLIEGAHANYGMGHKFLKHVERTKLLLFIVDIHGFQLSPKFPVRSALETIVLLNKELELYQKDLTEKPAILALNKSDLPNSYSIIEQVRNTLEDDEKYMKFLDSLPENFRPTFPMKFDKIIPVSAAKDMQSVNFLKKVIRKHLDINEDYYNLMQDQLNAAVVK